jgi:predicted metallopeptidase
MENKIKSRVGLNAVARRLFTRETKKLYKKLILTKRRKNGKLQEN